MRTILNSFTSQFVITSPTHSYYSLQLANLFIELLVQILCMTLLTVTCEHSLIAPLKSLSLRLQAAPFNQHDTLSASACFCSPNPKDPSSLRKSTAWERTRYHGLGRCPRLKESLIKLKTQNQHKSRIYLFILLLCSEVIATFK